MINMDIFERYINILIQSEHYWIFSLKNYQVVELIFTKYTRETKIHQYWSMDHLLPTKWAEKFHGSSKSSLASSHHAEESADLGSNKGYTCTWYIYWFVTIYIHMYIYIILFESKLYICVCIFDISFVFCSHLSYVCMIGD